MKVVYVMLSVCVVKAVYVLFVYLFVVVKVEYTISFVCESCI